MHRIYSNQMEKKKERKKKECCEQRRRWYYVRRYEGVWSVKGELIAVSYAHDIQAPSPPLDLQTCLCPGITLGHWQYVWGEWVTWIPSWEGKKTNKLKASVWRGIFWLHWCFWSILVSFSNCPRRCCFSLAHAAQARVWLGFIFMTYHFFAGKHSAQSQPFASARASIAAPARTQARTRWENSMFKHISPV